MRCATSEDSEQSVQSWQNLRCPLDETGTIGYPQTTIDYSYQTVYRKFLKYSDTQNICCNHPKIWTIWLYHRVMCPNDAEGMANSVDPDQRSSLIWVCIVCLGISVWKLRIITVDWVIIVHTSDSASLAGLRLTYGFLEEDAYEDHINGQGKFRHHFLDLGFIEALLGSKYLSASEYIFQRQGRSRQKAGVTRRACGMRWA